MTKLAQTWLDEKYADQTTKVIQLYKENVVSEELQGELKIKGYREVEEINLTRFDLDGEVLQGKMTSLMVSDCPKLKTLAVFSNELSKVIFEGNFPLLKTLCLPDNKLVELDVSKFPNLTSLNADRNNELKEIKGIEKTQLKITFLLGTPGLGFQLEKALTKEREAFQKKIKTLLGLKDTDPFPTDWEKKLTEKTLTPQQKQDLEKFDKAKSSFKEAEKELDKVFKFAKKNGKINRDETIKIEAFIEQVKPGYKI